MNSRVQVNVHLNVHFDVHLDVYLAVHRLVVHVDLVEPKHYRNGQCSQNAVADKLHTFVNLERVRDAAAFVEDKP